MVRRSRLGDIARKTRKFGEISEVVARKAGLGAGARKVRQQADKLAEIIEAAPNVLAELKGAEEAALKKTDSISAAAARSRR